MPPMTRPGGRSIRRDREWLGGFSINGVKNHRMNSVGHSG